MSLEVKWLENSQCLKWLVKFCYISSFNALSYCHWNMALILHLVKLLSLPYACFKLHWDCYISRSWTKIAILVLLVNGRQKRHVTIEAWDRKLVQGKPQNRATHWFSRPKEYIVSYVSNHTAVVYFCLNVFTLKKFFVMEVLISPTFVHF